VEAIVALPTDMFYNTGISTYVWVLSNHKPAPRRGLVQLIDGTELYSKMRKSLGSKRQYITDEQIRELVRLYGAFEETPRSKIFPTTAFGYRRITVERPLRLSFQVDDERIEAALAEKAIQKLDAGVRERIAAALRTFDPETVYKSRDRFIKVLKDALKKNELTPGAAEIKALVNALGERDPEAEICKTKGKPEPDTGLRDYENVPLGESVHEYFEREVKPHVPDAWIDEAKTDPQDGEIGIVGYEIPFNRHFYVFTPPRPLEEIDRDLKQCTDRIKEMIEELSG
jgi:type I restriction enzyme M protein